MSINNDSNFPYTAISSNLENSSADSKQLKSESSIVQVGRSIIKPHSHAKEREKRRKRLRVRYIENQVIGHEGPIREQSCCSLDPCLMIWMGVFGVVILSTLGIAELVKKHQ